MLTILIAEDEQFLREEIKKSINFRLLGCECAGLARNGQEAVDLIRSINPDIVLLDIKMPYYNGIEVLHATKREHSYEAIILSGYGEFEYAKQAIRYGVVDYLLKPIDDIELNKSLRIAVNKIRSRILSNPPMVDELLAIHSKSSYSKNVIQIIEKQYASNISLEDIANQVGTSADYLNRVFKKDSTYTVYQYLLRYRIAKACVLLTQPDKKVYEIAYLVGFTEYRRFYETFRKLTKISPGEYRDKI